MFCDSFAFAQVMSCFGCFGGSERSRHSPNPYDDDTYSHDSGETSNPGGDDEEGEEEEEVEELSRSKRSEEILKCKLQNGLVCRQFPVKETNKLTRGEDEDGNKTINEFVRERKIGSGSYGKVVLYRSTVDDKHYAIKVCSYFLFPWHHSKAYFVFLVFYESAHWKLDHHSTDYINVS
jgi:[calcium/calmodulin-dependent protein kinase] kinase